MSTRLPPPDPMIPAVSLKRLLTYRTWVLFTLASLLVLAAAGLSQPAWGDEAHFVATIGLFARDISPRLIQDYPEVTPPLTFALYALWTKLAGSSLTSLRIFTLLIAFVTWNVLFRFLARVTDRPQAAWGLALLVTINPYFLGTSIFVFTDMPAILFTLLAAWMLWEERLARFSLCVAAAVLCRQYAVVLPLAVIVEALYTSVAQRTIRWRPLLAAGSGLLPLAALMIVWHGTAPTSGLRLWYVPNAAVFNLHAITSYLAFGTIYAIPVVAWVLLRSPWRRTDILISAVGVLWTLIVPVAASEATIQQTSYRTVGLVHRAIIGLLGDSTIAHVLLAACVAVGCLAGIRLLRSLHLPVRGETEPLRQWLPMLWPLFLLIMPFSYQVWEKYLLLILPFLLPALLHVIPAGMPARGHS